MKDSDVLACKWCGKETTRGATRKKKTNPLRCTRCNGPLKTKEEK